MMFSFQVVLHNYPTFVLEISQVKKIRPGSTAQFKVFFTLVINVLIISSRRKHINLTKSEILIQ